MIAAVIPTRYRPPQLGNLLSVLLSDGIQPIVLESDDYGHAIYRMWNAGVEKARIVGARTIAVLNDDIEIKPGAVAFMAQVLDDCRDIGVVYPDVTADWEHPVYRGLERTQGSWGAGGMTGFCFLFRADLPIPFDESFNWWYGDDAFEEAVRGAGLGVARVTGVPIRHIPGRSASQRSDLGPLIEADRALWEARHAA
ncbi:MAG: hypothetical protein PHS14_18855 [Elusimicrobia bacterium]|nr:hypothetical protein [Elusimicrobiota bacterium]